MKKLNEVSSPEVLRVELTNAERVKIASEEIKRIRLSYIREKHSILAPDNV